MGQLSIAYLNTLTFACIQMVLYTTIPYIAEKTGVTTANIIGAISVGSFLFTFMGPYWATRSDSLGRKKVLGIGMLGMSLSFTLLTIIFLFNTTLSLSVKILFVFLSRIFYGLLSSAIVPVSQAWQLDLSPKHNHLKVLTKNSMFLNLGRILGPILVLIKQVNFEFVIYFATVWVSLLTLFNLFSYHPVKQKIEQKSFNFKALLLSWKTSFQESMFPILLALIFTAFVGVLYSFLGHHLKVVLSLTGQEATIMFAKIILVLSLLAVILQQISISLFKNNWRPRVIIGSISIIIGTIIMMLTDSHFFMWLSIFFISIATAFIPPAYLRLTSESKENNDKTNVFGKKLGLASVAHSLGYALGTALIAISMKWKIIPESIVVILISIAILFVSIFMIVKTQKAQSVETSNV